MISVEDSEETGRLHFAGALRYHHLDGSAVWTRLEAISNQEFTKLVKGLRDRGMTNDDVTLLRCKLGRLVVAEQDEATL